MKRKILMAIAIGVLATLSIAQGGGAGRPPGGQGGPGGPGGPGGGQRRSGGGGGFGILRIAEVQKELKITAAQKAQLDKILPAPGGGGPGGGGPGGPGGARPKPEETQKKIDAVLNASQKARFAELRLQSAGPGAFGRDDVAKKLALTGAQRKTVEAALQSARPQMGGMQGGQPDFAKIRKEMETKRAAAMKTITASLSASQKATWAKMIGKPFKFPAMQFRMGGPGGPGGGRPPSPPSKGGGGKGGG